MSIQPVPVPALPSAGRLEEYIPRIESAVATAMSQLKAIVSAMNEVDYLLDVYRVEYQSFHAERKYDLAEVRRQRIVGMTEVMEVIEKHMRVARATQRAGVK